jgi:hypothetical protein
VKTALSDPDRERVRLPVGLAALALLCASLAVAILFARFLQRGGAGELARLVAERGSIDRQLGRVRDAGPGAVDAAVVAVALGPDGLPTGESESDPQRTASHRSFHGGDAGVGAIPFQETWARGHVVSVEGQASTHAGAECWVRVLPVGGSGYNCLVRVMCGGALLYPDDAQQAGYAPCEVEDGHVVRGTDSSTSGRDGDPTLDLDLVRHQLRVHDSTPQQGDAYFEQLGASRIPTFAAEIALDPSA